MQMKMTGGAIYVRGAETGAAASRRWTANRFIHAGLSRLVAVLAVGFIMALSGTAQAVTPLTPAMDSFTIQPGQTVHRQLNCGLGAKVVGGGALTSTPFARVWRSFPDATNQHIWHVSVTSWNSVPETVWARATCATGFVSYWNFASSTGNFGSGTYATGTATCDSNRVAMGGGFIAPNANFVIVSTHVQGNGWRVRGYNGSGGTGSVGVLVTCSGSLGARNVTFETTTVAPGGAAFPIPACAAGRWLASGGYRSTIDTPWTIVTGNLPDWSNFKAWKWNLKNLDTVSHTYERTLVCFNL